MSFSQRATTLMRELDLLLLEIDASCVRIAAQIEAMDAIDNIALKKDTRCISDAVRRFPELVAQVDAGPDEPANTSMAQQGSASVAWSDLTNRIRRLRGPLSQWVWLEGRINKIQNFGPHRLYQPPHRVTDVEAQLNEATDAAFDLLHKYVSPSNPSEDAKARGGFADIPLPQTTFLRHMLAAHRITLAQRLGRPARFLDVGCGAGFKVMSAAKFFKPAEGFDFDPLYVTAAQQLLDTLGLEHTSIFEADGLNFDRYDEYDVIYFFRPMSDIQKLHQLESHIIKHARPDALLIAPYSLFDARYEALGCGLVADRIYLAQSSQETATALRKKAEFIGPGVPQELSQISNIWTPIMSAMRANGFGCR